jgi:hypothetical protein
MREHWPERAKRRWGPLGGPHLLFEVEDIDDYPGVSVSQNNVPTNDDAFAIGWWGRQFPLKVNWNHVNLPLQVRRKCLANHEPPFETRGQSVLPGESWRYVPIVRSIPTADFVTVMIREAVPTAIVIVVMVLMFVAPVAVVVIPMLFMIFVGASGESHASRNCKSSDDDKSEPFFRLQWVPPKE